MFQAWYMAVDTQMFFVAPFFIYTMWHWRRLGPILTALATIVSLIIPAVITYKDSLDPTMLFYAKYVVFKSLKLVTNWVLFFFVYRIIRFCSRRFRFHYVVMFCLSFSLYYYIDFTFGFTCDLMLLRKVLINDTKHLF